MNGRLQCFTLLVTMEKKRVIHFRAFRGTPLINYNGKDKVINARKVFVACLKRNASIKQCDFIYDRCILFA